MGRIDDDPVIMVASWHHASVETNQSEVALSQFARGRVEKISKRLCGSDYTRNTLGGSKAVDKKEREGREGCKFKAGME